MTNPNASARTSTNDPLRVDFLSSAALGLSGRIGLTIAPGKRDLGRRWDRDLTADLARLRGEYNASLLVSLMERAEYAFLGIPDLLERAEAAGIATRWFPIRDVDAPAPATMPAFRALVEAIVATARRGETVVIHCRGGVGRSGVVAAACLVALGHGPDEAIAWVRQARAGAVEVRTQERWVAEFAAARRENKAPPSVDTIRGCLVGGALGDALGAPIEFAGSAEIVRRHGAAVPASLAYAGGAKGHITDDTQMTLFTAEGVILAAQSGPGDSATAMVQMALLRWYETQTGRVATGGMPGWLIDEQRLHVQRAPGTTCMSALSLLARDPTRAHTVDSPPNDSKGCGAVMRSAPIGLVAPTRADAFARARDAGVLTHGHPSGYLSGAYLASLIWDLARGESLVAAMGHADALLANERGNAEMIAILGRVRALAAKGVPDVAAIESLGGGWTGEESLAIALLCALTADPNEPDVIASAVWRSVLHSGDSDSTGSITGNLLGAMLGERRLPARWLRQLELRDVIERVADDLHAVVAGEAQDWERCRTRAAAELIDSHTHPERHKMTSTARAFLFGWNPKQFKADQWTGLDALVREGAGDDYWNSASGQPRVNDWAFAVKLGPQGRGIFARGHITSIKKKPTKPGKKSEWHVRMHWDEFLDPREASNLLAFPKSARRPRQKWDAESNGTEVKNFPVAELHELWTQHHGRDRQPGVVDGPPHDVLVLIKKKKFEATLAAWRKEARVGEVVTFGRWNANSPQLAELAHGGSLWMITVRPGGRVWLVAHYPRPSLKIATTGDRFRIRSKPAPNEVAMQDITDLVGALRFTNRIAIAMEPTKVAHSAQTVGILEHESAQLLRDAVAGGHQTLLAEHTFLLRPNARVLLRVPQDLTTPEAEQIGAYVKALVKPAPPPVPGPTSAPGLGPSKKPPKGKKLTLPDAVKVQGSLRGAPTTGTPVGSGVGHVDVGLKLAGGNDATTVRLPAGTMMTSKRADVQHGVLAQAVEFVVPANTTTHWILRMYCANKTRSPAGEDAEFDIGPVASDPVLDHLFRLLEPKEIPEDMVELVQEALWEITDDEGLTPETLSKLAALPSRS